MRTLAVAGFLFLAANAADASTLVDMGNDTYDTASGLTWLDMNLTANMSVNQALTANSGYRVATQNEVMQLFADADLPTSTGGSAAILGAATDIVALMGTTFGDSLNYGFQGLALGTGGVYYNEPFVGVYTTSGIGYVYAGLNPSGWLSGGTFGSIYLVTDIAPVPLPAGGLVLLTALGTLVLGRKSRKTA